MDVKSTRTRCIYFFFFRYAVAKFFWNIRWEPFQSNDINTFMEIIFNACDLLPLHAEDTDDFILFAALVLDQIWVYWMVMLHL